MEKVRNTETQARIDAINHLVKAMKKGKGRTIGYEIEPKDGDGFFVPTDEFNGYVPEFKEMEEQNFKQVNEILRDCSTLEEVAKKIAQAELYLDDLRIEPYIDYEAVLKFFPQEGYVSSLRQGGFKPSNVPGVEFGEVIDIGKAWALGKRKIDEIPDEVLLNDPAFVLGYINGHSNDFRNDLQEEFEDEEYYKYLEELAEKTFEKMPVVTIQQARKAKENAKDVATNPNGRGE